MTGAAPATAGAPRFEGRPNIRRAVLVASLITFAAPTGVVLAVLVVTFLLASSATGWAGIGYAYIGAGTAVLAGVVALGVAARASFARALPAGARLRPGLACALATAAVLFTAGGRVGFAVVPTRWALVLLPLPFLLPLALTSHLRWRWVAAPVALLTAGTVAVSTVQDGAERTREEAGQQASLTRFDTTLPLVQGRTLQEPRPGWQLIDVFLPPTASSPVGVLWRSDVNTAAEVGHQLEVTQTATDCVADGASCTVVGDGRHGPVRRYRDASYSFVTVGGVEWQLTGSSDTEAVEVLNGLDGVGAQEFLAAAETATEVGRG